MTQNIITRFPPSPTGHAHIGSYRTAIFNYLFARKHKGKFLLRIEDTDKARSQKEYQDGIIESLKWLGLEYDDFSIQTNNVEKHTAAMNAMIEKGLAYISHEEAKDGSGVMKDVVRFKNPNKVVTFTDLILGDISVDTTDLGDFVIGRNIHDPLYHLAVTVDDINSGVTHVIRGMDHISNTPRQILLIEAMGGSMPIYAHIPLVLGEDKQKLSKRKGALSVLEYEKRGYLPQAILNAATFIGFNPGGEKEIYTKEELIDVFDITRVQKAGAVFNPVKLDWFNQEHMKLLSENEYLTRAHAFVPEELKTEAFDAVLNKVLLAQRDRLVYFGQIPEVLTEASYTYTDIDTPSVELLMVPEKLRKDTVVTKQSTKDILEKVLEIIKGIEEQDFTTAESVKPSLWDLAEKEGRGIVLWPLRIALTNKEKSFDPFTTLSILGKDTSIQRIEKAIQALQ